MYVCMYPTDLPADVHCSTVDDGHSYIIGWTGWRQ